MVSLPCAMQHLHGHRGMVAAAGPSPLQGAAVFVQGPQGPAPLCPRRPRAEAGFQTRRVFCKEIRQARRAPQTAIPMAGNLQASGHEPQTLKPASCRGHRLGNELWSRLEPLGAQPALPHPTQGHRTGICKGWGAAARPHRAAWGLQGHFIICCRSLSLVSVLRRAALGQHHTKGAHSRAPVQD